MLFMSHSPYGQQQRDMKYEDVSSFKVINSIVFQTRYDLISPWCDAITSSASKARSTTLGHSHYSNATRSLEIP